MTITYDWFIKNKQEEEIWAYRPTLTKEQCEDIIKYGLSLESNAGVINGNTSVDIDLSVRKSRVSWIPSNNPETHWIFQHCTEMVREVNETFFNYDLLYIQSLQFTQYDGKENSFYRKHNDTVFKNNASRKLSFSILLSDETSFEGGDLLLHYSSNPVAATRKQGVAVAFPSHMLHEVVPVNKGIRYSLVGWVVGPRFK
jgi:PKHD-type hydroxylase